MIGIKGSWWTLAERYCSRLLRWTTRLLLALPAITIAAPDSPSLARSIPEMLSPDTLPSRFFTFSPEEYWREPRDSYWLSFSNWVLRQERVQGARVQSLGAWADRTLSGSSQALPDNESYLRLGFATESEYSKLARFEPEMRFRLDIPTTRRKLRLVIESESEELIPLEERQRDRQLTEPERTDAEATGALRYLTRIGDAINLSSDLGGRLRLPPDAFWRATASNRWPMARTVDTRVAAAFLLLSPDGLGGADVVRGRPVVGRRLAVPVVIGTGMGPPGPEIRCRPDFQPA